MISTVLLMHHIMHECLTDGAFLHYVVPHSYGMNGKELLQLLMQQSGHNPNSLADKLGKRSLQSLIARFLNGATKNPRAETLSPVATYFGVPPIAFVDDATATSIARDRGLISEQYSSSTDVTAIDARSRRADPTIVELTIVLGRHLAKADPGARSAAAALLQHLAHHPGSAAATGAHLASLLGEGPQESQPASTNFR